MFEWIEQKGITFDHDFAYYFSLNFLLPPKKMREEEKEKKLAKIVIKGHAFLLDRLSAQILRNNL